MINDRPTEFQLSGFLRLGDTGGGGRTFWPPWYLTLQNHVDNLRVKAPPPPLLSRNKLQAGVRKSKGEAEIRGGNRAHISTSQVKCWATLRLYSHAAAEYGLLTNTQLKVEWKPKRIELINIPCVNANLPLKSPQNLALIIQDSHWRITEKELAKICRQKCNCWTDTKPKDCQLKYLSVWCQQNHYLQYC